MNSSNPASISSASVRHSHLHLIFRSNKKNGKLQEKFNSCYQSLRRNRRAPVEWTLDSNVPATYLTAREHHYKARTGFIFLAKKSRSTVRFSWFQTWLLLNNIQPFQWAYRLHRPLLRASGLWEREWLWDRKRRRLPRWAGSPRNFKPLFQSVLCTSALFKSMLSSKQSYSTPNSLLKYNYPSVFRRFLLQFRRDLSPNDRAEFKFWCKGQIPGSKLDIDPANVEDFLGLMESLLDSNTVSLTDLSLLEEFLIIVGRLNLLQSLKQVELQISLSGILEGYIKSVIHLRHGTPVKLVRDQANIAKFLLTIKEIDEELISPVLNRQLEQVEDDRVVLQVIKSPLLKTSSLSWSKFTFYLVFIGEFYASFSWPRNQLPDVVADGHFTSLFSDTKTCELLTEWMLENGGLVSDWNKYATYVKFTAKIISLCSDLSKFYCEVDRTGKFVSQHRGIYFGVLIGNEEYLWKRREGW